MDSVEQDDDDELSNDSEVDSEYEALLYSQIHHQYQDEIENVEITNEIKDANLHHDAQVVHNPAPNSCSSINNAIQSNDKYLLVSPKISSSSSFTTVSSLTQTIETDLSQLESTNSSNLPESSTIIETSRTKDNNKIIQLSSDVSVSLDSAGGTSSSDSDDDWFQDEYQKVCDENITINVSSSTANTSVLSNKSNNWSNKRKCGFSDPTAVKKLRGDRAIKDANLETLPEVEAAMRSFYDSDCSEFEVEDVWQHMDQEPSRQSWKLDFQDTSFLTSRYFSKPGRSNIMCHNCKHRGHLSRDCPDPKKPMICYLCGMIGHTSSRCPFQMCSRCMQPGHGSQACRIGTAFTKWFCKRCSVNGHTDHLCPGLWRMYHLTTKNDGKIVRPTKPSTKKKHCSNCAQRGHLIHECKKMKYTYFVPPPIVVTSYETKAPNLLLQSLGIPQRHPISAPPSRNTSPVMKLPKKKKQKNNSPININWKAFQAKCVEKIERMTKKKKQVKKKKLDNGETNGKVKPAKEDSARKQKLNGSSASKKKLAKSPSRSPISNITANAKSKNIQQQKSYSNVNGETTSEVIGGNKNIQKLSKRLRRQKRSEMRKNGLSENLKKNDNKEKKKSIKLNFKADANCKQLGNHNNNSGKLKENGLKVSVGHHNENVNGPKSDVNKSKKEISSSSPTSKTGNGNKKKRTDKKSWVGWKDFREQQAYVNSMNFNNIGDKKKTAKKFLNAWFDIV